MGIKISDLTSATSLTGSEELPIVQSGNTKKTTINDILALLSSSRSVSNIEQLRSTNSGDLVGIGDRAEVGEIEPREETKTDEPIEDNTEAKESGENDELR